MTNRQRAVIIVGVTFALMLPYMGFVMYGVFRFPSGQWPLWTAYTLLLWFVANIVIVMLVARKIFRGQAPQPGGTKNIAKIAMLRNVPLVILWSGMFIYGAVETIQGKIPWNRALPVGAFLLLFIGVFGWGLVQGLRKKAG